LLTHIGRIVNRFLTTGTVNKGKSSGQTAVSDKIVEDLRQRVEETPQISVSRLSQQSGVPPSICHKIIKNIYVTLVSL
jgi:ribosomal protein S25